MHRSLALLVGGTVVLGCAAAAAPGGAGARVRPGIEVLLADSAHLVRGRRVGLVTNQTGIDSRGVSDVEVLRDAGVRLVALFSPEHGFRGAADPGAAIATTIDSATGLPIYSLYGRTSAPTDTMLAGLDAKALDGQAGQLRRGPADNHRVHIDQRALAHTKFAIIACRSILPNPTRVEQLHPPAVGRLP